MALNAKQQLFVKEYLKDGNGTRAAKAAGYGSKSKGKKADKIAGVQATRLLANASVASAIKAGLARVTEKAELKAADVLAELQKLAFVDITKAFKSDGEMKPLDELDEDVRKAIVGIEMIELFAGRGSLRRQIGHVRKFKSADKVRALEMLAKHFKLLTDVHEHTGKNGGPLVILTMPSNGSEAPKPKTPDKKE